MGRKDPVRLTSRHPVFTALTYEGLMKIAQKKVVMFPTALNGTWACVIVRIHGVMLQ